MPEAQVAKQVQLICTKLAPLVRGGDIDEHPATGNPVGVTTERGDGT